MNLIFIILIPFIGIIFCLLHNRIHKISQKWIALFSVVSTLFLTVFELFKKIQERNFNWISQFQFPWIPNFGIKFHLSLDNLSFLMIFSTTIVSITAILCSWKEVKDKEKNFFYTNLLSIFLSTIGIFLASDLFLFFLFWEISSISIFFLISFWNTNSENSKKKYESAKSFFMYSQMSSAFMFLGILFLVIKQYQTTNILSFSYFDILKIRLGIWEEYFIMILFLFSFIIKLPIIPFHGWLVKVQSNSHFSGTVDLISIIIKTSAYAILKINTKIFPTSSYYIENFMMIFGIINIVYGSVCALSHKNIKKIISYSTISQMGFILIGIYANNRISYKGTIVQIISYSLCTSGIIAIFGQIFQRVKTYNIEEMNFSKKKYYFFYKILGFFLFSYLGIPGSVSFVGKIMISFGNFFKHPIVSIISIFSFFLSSIYCINILHKVFNIKFIEYSKIKKIRFLEKFILLWISFFILILGVFPNIILNSIEK
ncbi:complex I subunit 4 family protein [bacterium endosymbiont of Pedicinus badii]|uniref:complex I subunit 4 family protein n=1 Tax=bacterium endosymbiont of Pedicinus badii TaxID=1719126 RepID=UPI0009BB22FC|nr:NADH-quinone oxidoreductase subunit M [bacterium endosymbiont of Pedicinus badii]OQM34446.1 hypothetical protein AOQ89_00975 [bacterium endosymbiont of Pedicinus badii]